jgi:serine/threonine-protein kinase RsbW
MTEATRDNPSGTVRSSVVALLDHRFDRAGLAGARQQLRLSGAASGLADRALFNFVLAVNEIMTNAVRHGGGHGRLSLWRDGDDLLCQVTDSGTGLPRQRLPDPLRQPVFGGLNGHGLWLADHVSDGMEVEADRLWGTRVRLRFALPAERG